MGNLFVNASPIEIVWCLTDLLGAVFAGVLLVLNVALYRRQQNTRLNGGLAILLLGEVIGLFLWLTVFLLFLGVGWAAAMAPVRPDVSTNVQAYNWATYAPALLLIGNFAMLVMVFVRMVMWLMLDHHNRQNPQDRRSTDRHGETVDLPAAGPAARVLIEVQAMQADMADIHAASAPPPGGPDAVPMQVTIVQDPHAPVPVIVQPTDDGKPGGGQA